VVPPKTQVLIRARQVLYHLSHTSSPFLFYVFFLPNRVLHLCSGWPGPQSSNLCFSCGWDDRHEPPHPAFNGRDGGLTNCVG
jgi:hypothetical protein